MLCDGRWRTIKSFFIQNDAPWVLQNVDPDFPPDASHVKHLDSDRMYLKPCMGNTCTLDPTYNLWKDAKEIVFFSLKCLDFLVTFSEGLRYLDPKDYLFILKSSTAKVVYYFFLTLWVRHFTVSLRPGRWVSWASWTAPHSRLDSRTWPCCPGTLKNEIS